MNRISIIIPVLNEEQTIGKLLNHLLATVSHKNGIEIIVVDGGSDDNTKTIVSNFSDATLIESKKGRAIQMNTGAAIAKGSILYFLHADSFPPKHFDKHILLEVKKNNLAGCFKMRFDHTHWWLRLAGWLTQYSWRACRGGDQSQFITKSLFEELNGFDETYTIYEDNDLINKLYKRKEFVVIQEWLTTSARRYEDNGIWKIQYHFWTIYVKKWFGASAKELHQYYSKYIS